MNVRISQIDGKLPNLALMRLSAFHKSRGDTVIFSRSLTRQLDEPSYSVVYGSSIFKFSQHRTEQLRREFPEAIIGGTGTDSLKTVEDIVGDFNGKDYAPWPEFRASLGFTQRGCRLSCKFCVVPAKEGKPQSVATIYDLWRGEPYPKHIHLLDNDFFGAPNWRDRIKEIREGGFKVCFNQGINVRMITDEAAEALASIDYRDDGFTVKRIYTAWDNLKDEKVFFDGIARLQRAGIKPTHVMAYMLVGFDKSETWERILYRFRRMVDVGILPFPMVFDRTRADLRRFQRYVVRRYYQLFTWEQYCNLPPMRTDDRTGYLFAV